MSEYPLDDGLESEETWNSVIDMINVEPLSEQEEDCMRVHCKHNEITTHSKDTYVSTYIPSEDTDSDNDDRIAQSVSPETSLHSHEDQPAQQCDQHSNESISLESYYMDRRDAEMYSSVYEALLNYACNSNNDTDYCKLSCTMSCCCKRRDLESAIVKHGKRAGWTTFREMIFPLFRPFVRDLIALAEFTVSLIGLIFFVALVLKSVSQGTIRNNLALTVTHLTLVLLFVILALVDLIMSLRFSGALKTCLRNVRFREWKVSTTCNCIKAGIHQEPNRKEPKVMRYFDVGRILISEAILYPLLICDLMAFIINKRYNSHSAESITAFVLFLLSSASVLFFVYIMRLAVLISLSFYLSKKRELPRSNVTTMQGEDPDPIDHKIITNATQFQHYFIAHVAGQMVVQILMIIAIISKFAADNDGKTFEDPIYISSRLWFMLAVGYVMQSIGILTFFIPTNRWISQYPVGICVNLLSILEIPGIDYIIFPNDTQQGAHQKIEKIAGLLNKKDLTEAFLKLYNKSLCTKITYPSVAPCLVLACFIYSYVYFAFIAVAFVEMLECYNKCDTSHLYPEFVLLGGILFIVNTYTFIVSITWTLILIILAIILGLVVVLVLAVSPPAAIFLCICCPFIVIGCPGLLCLICKKCCEYIVLLLCNCAYF